NKIFKCHLRLAIFKSNSFHTFVPMGPLNSKKEYFKHTLKEEVVISGAGIHTGHSVTMRIKPAGTNSGINFQRTDLPGKPVVKANVDNVIETNRSTTIESNGARVGTIEH